MTGIQEFPSPLLRLSPRLTLAGDPGASLVGINTTQLPDGALCWVSGELSDFRLFLASTAAADGIDVLQPSAGPGRWVRQQSFPWPGSLSCGPLVDGAVREILPTGSLYPTDVVWYKDATKTIELLHLTYTRDGSGKVTQAQWVVNDLTGSLTMTITDTISYSGFYESERTRVIT